MDSKAVCGVAVCRGCQAWFVLSSCCSQSGESVSYLSVLPKIILRTQLPSSSSLSWLPCRVRQSQQFDDSVFGGFLQHLARVANAGMPLNPASPGAAQRAMAYPPNAPSPPMMAPPPQYQQMVNSPGGSSLTSAVQSRSNSLAGQIGSPPAMLPGGVSELQRLARLLVSIAGTQHRRVTQLHCSPQCVALRIRIARLC